MAEKPVSLDFTTTLDLKPIQSAVVKAQKAFKKALQIPTKVSQEGAKSLKDVRRAVQGSTKNFYNFVNAIKDAAKAEGYLGREALKSYAGIKGGIEAATAVQSKLFKRTAEYEKKVRELKQAEAEVAKQSKAGAGAEADRLVAAQDYIQLKGEVKAAGLEIQETLAELSEARLKVSVESEGARKAIADVKALREEQQEALEEQQKVLEEAAKTAKEFKNFKLKGKDVAEGFGEALGTLPKGDIEGFAKLFAKGLGSGAKALGAAATRASERAKLAGGPGAGKGMGALGSTIAAAAGPIGMGVAAVGALAGAFMDVEKEVKSFQREIWASSGSLGYFAKSTLGAEATAKSFSSKLRRVSKSAWDAQNNLKWGITHDDHKSFLSTLGQEGVTVDRLDDEFEKLKKSTLGTSLQIEQFGDLTGLAMSYSRMMGVSLDEVTRMQGQMMTDLGMGLEETILGFSDLAKSASESGMATNKFFGVIRAAEADLNLYGVRLKDTAHTLTMMSHAMSPKTASKFMQSLQQGFKGQDIATRFKTVMLTGTGPLKKIIKEDLGRNVTALADKLKGVAGGGINEDLIKKAISGGKGSEEAMKQVRDGVNQLAPKQASVVREAIIEAEAKAGQLKGGAMDTAAAMDNLSPQAFADAQMAGIKKWSGGKKLSKLSGMQLHVATQLFGVTQEQIMGMAKYEAAADDRRADLVKKVEAGDPEALAQIKKMNIQFTNSDDLQKKLSERSNASIVDTYDEATKKQLTTATEQVNYAKQTVEATTSLSDKLEAIKEFLKGGLYNAILKIASFGSDEDAIAELAADTENATIQAAYKASKGKPKEFAAALEASETYKDMTGVLESFSEGNKAMTQEQVKAAEGTTRALYKSIVGSEGGAEKLSTTVNAMRLGGQSVDLANTKDLAAVLHRALTDKSIAGTWGAKALGSQQAKLLETFAAQQKAAEEKAQQDKENAPAPGAAPAPVAPPTTGTPAAKALPPGPKEEKADKKAQKTAEAQHKEAKKANKIATHDGMKVNKQTIEKDFGKMTKESVLDSVRTALLEFALYKDDPAALLKNMKESGKSLAETLEKGRTESITAGENKMVKANQEGGTVMRPAPGEAFTSVAPGEKIVPKGGGGGGETINVNVAGIGGNDLKRMIEAKVTEGIWEYKRRERLH